MLNYQRVCKNPTGRRPQFLEQKGTVLRSPQRSVLGENGVNTVPQLATRPRRIKKNAEASKILEKSNEKKLVRISQKMSKALERLQSWYIP